MYLTLTKLPFPICHTLAVPNISSFCSSIPPATESPLPYHFTLISRPAFKRVDLTCLSPSISIPGRLPIHSTFQPLHSPYVAFLSKSTLPLCYFPTNIKIIPSLFTFHKGARLTKGLHTDSLQIVPLRFVAQSLKMTYRAPPPPFTAAQ
jgi:hypothetical protein